MSSISSSFFENRFAAHRMHDPGQRMSRDMDLNAIRERRARLEALTAQMKLPELTPEAANKGNVLQRRRSYVEISSADLKKANNYPIKSRKPTGHILQPLSPRPGEENELDRRARNDALLIPGRPPPKAQNEDLPVEQEPNQINRSHSSSELSERKISDAKDPIRETNGVIVPPLNLRSDTEDNNSKENNDKFNKEEENKNGKIDDIEKIDSNTNGTSPVDEQQMGQGDTPQDPEEIRRQIPGIVEKIKSEDEAMQLEGTQEARKHLSLEKDAPINEYIEADLIPHVHSNLTRTNNQTLQFESLWVLTNLTSGTEENTKAVLEDGCLPDVIKSLDSPYDNVKMQAVWTISNIAGEGRQYRDEVIAYGVIPYLYKVSKHYNDPKTYDEKNLEILSWTFVNLVRHRPFQITDKEIDTCIEICKMFLFHEKPSIHQEALWFFFYLTDENGQHIDRVLEANILPRIIELTDSPESTVQSPALRTLGSILAGNDEQTTAVIEAGGLEALKKLLVHRKPTIRKEAAWALSNILAGTQAQIQQVIDAGIIKELIKRAEDNKETTSVRKESIWGLANLAKSGSSEQVQEILYMSGMSAYQEILKVEDHKTLGVALLGLISVAQNVASSQPIMRKMIKQEVIESLSESENEQISESAKKLLDIVYR